MYIKPKKSLGQNFLVDKNIIRKIISSPSFTGADIVLEIGSGRGELALALAKVVKQVYALEIDQRLYPELEKNLNGLNNCQVIKNDILKFDITKFCESNRIGQKLRIIGNIPYYISSPIIEHLINHSNHIKDVYLTVQKEFARRVIAIPGSKDYGSFSCFVQYYAKAKILFNIKNSCFKPMPKVDSSFLALEFREKPEIEVKDEDGLFKLIRTAFSQRRKTLRNSLSEFLTRLELELVLSDLGVSINARAEELSLVQFIRLYNYLAQQATPKSSKIH
ncbi:MAG: 16S rRNA (adenine(1518)-N(6)/adenine(1519)-N(6))-dimethyltransferase RsmA [Actinobacteria bacterium]|nr:16S rRNA (adenine(1518)-N(6)/adenine(1519)-N(6))-dimethyltransferase RsmA [Actinomycetota bacterium]